MTEDEREEALYLESPFAFWLRPDRHDHGVPCWEVEGEYIPKSIKPKKVELVLNRADHTWIRIHNNAGYTYTDKTTIIGNCDMQTQLPIIITNCRREVNDR